MTFIPSESKFLSISFVHEIMKNYMRFIALCLSSTLLTGCNCVNLSKLEHTKWTRIAVVDDVDNSLTVTVVGTTVFNNNSLRYEVPELDITALIDANVVQPLREAMPWELVRSKPFETALANGRDIGIRPSSFNPPADLKQALADADCDAIAVLQPRVLQGANGIEGYGVGLYRHEFLGVCHTRLTVCLYATVYDAVGGQNSGIRLNAVRDLDTDFELTRNWSELPAEVREEIVNGIREIFETDIRAQAEKIMDEFKPQPVFSF